MSRKKKVVEEPVIKEPEDAGFDQSPDPVDDTFLDDEDGEDEDGFST